MSSSQTKSISNSEGAKAEQIIFEFFAKSLHIILESRTPYMSSRNFNNDQINYSPSPSPSPSSSSSSSSVRPRDKWFNLALRECPAALESFDIGRQSSLEPLVVDVVLGWDELCSEMKNEQIIERWIVQYDNRKVRDSQSVRRLSNSNKLQVMYKKAILLLRSLFVMVRLLPAYKIFRELNSSGQLRNFKLVPKVPSIVEPITRREESEMQKFSFTPVETICGRLCLSVLYRDVTCEPSSAPMSPTFITDYVGSPLADPLKRFPSLPLSYGSPPLLPFQRRHSWSFDPYKVSPPSVSCSPSPTRSDSNALVLRWIPVHPSPPSPAPIHNLSRGITRTESAPVRIPAPCPTVKVMTRHPSLKPVTEKMFVYGRDDFRRHSGVMQSTNSSPRVSFSQSSSRSFRDDFDESDFPCPFDVEDDDITDPRSRQGSFDQRGDIHEHVETSGSFPKKSQDAAVGALVQMLKKAPPLRQDVSESSVPEICLNNSNKPAQADEIAVTGSSSMTASGIAMASKTTADALEELKSYKEMKKKLLSLSSTSNPS